MFSIARRPIALPVTVDPVNEIFEISGELTSALPQVDPPPVTTLKTPGGTPVSMASSASQRAVSGVTSDGLSTSEQPAARDGIRVTWASGDNKWESAFAVTNLFDKTYYISVFDLLGSSGAKYGTPDNPREYSLSLKRKF
jgi:outer membrane receptor protein involved in Fe transport